jgi:hypothetical protein
MFLRLPILALGLSLFLPGVVRANDVYDLTVAEPSSAQTGTGTINLVFVEPSILTATTTGITSFSTNTLGGFLAGCSVGSLDVDAPSASTDVELAMTLSGGCIYSGQVATADFNQAITSLTTYAAYNDFSFDDNIGTLSISCIAGTPGCSGSIAAPEPSSFILLGLGLSVLGGVLIFGRKRFVLN